MAVGVGLGFLGAVAAGEDDPALRFREGDSVRINMVQANGMPSVVGAFKRQDELEQWWAQADEAEAAGRPISVEGTIGIGHNTPATVASATLIRIGGKRHEVAQVTLKAGTLKGEEFWVSARRLRLAYEPDPVAAPVKASIPLDLY
jgi:hypothetical protein